MFLLPLLVLLARVPTAHARGLVRLVYEKDPGVSCGDEQLLRRAVTERLASDPFSNVAAALVLVQVRASTASAREDEYEGTVTLIQPGHVPTEERHLRGQCDPLMATLALTVSLAIDPDSTWRPMPPPLEAEKTEPRSVAVAPEERRHLWRLSAGGGPTFSAGDAPAPVLGALLYVAGRRDLVGGMLDLRATLPGSTSTALGRGSSWSLSFEAAPCLHAWLLFGCAVGQIGIMTASGDAVAAPTQTEALIASVGGRIGLALPVDSRFELRLHGDASASLTRHRLRAQGLDVYEYAPGSIGLGALAGIRF